MFNMKAIYFACCIVLVLGASNCKDEKVFRSDYEYYQEADGWFKLHRYPVKWQTARLRCAYEGAMLASPTTYGMAAVLRSFAAKNRVILHTGIHSTVSDGDFNSLDGIPFSEIPVKWLQDNPNNYNNIENCIVYHGEGLVEDLDCLHPHAFVCYKKHSKDLVLTECGTTDKEYKMDARTNKCYKFHRIGRPFAVAASVCTAEGGHLAIINSETEAGVLRDVFAHNPGPTLAAAYPDATYLGYYNWDDSSFYGTVHGQTLEEAGYAKWSDGQPSFTNAGKPQKCGGMFRNTLLDDMSCDENISFICEKHPESLRKTIVDIRLGEERAKLK